MPEFRIEGESLRREGRIRWMLWGLILLPTAMTLFLIALRIAGMKFGPVLTGTLIGSFFIAFLGSIPLTLREAIKAAELQMVFELDSDSITRKRPGYKPIRIAFSEVCYVGEELGQLIIRGEGPQRKIGIPKAVNGYNSIQNALNKNCSVPLQKSTSMTRVLIFMSMVYVAAILILCTRLALK